MIIRKQALCFAIAILLTSCTEGLLGGADTTDPETVVVGGYIQKGPFIEGTDVAIQELDGALNPTGKSFKTQTSDDQGSFNVECITSSEYAEFVAEGFYFDEIIGKISSNRLTLRALSKVDNRTNINILTTLQCNRMKTLLRSGISYDEAAAQSKEEVLGVFGLAGRNLSDFEDMNIAKGGESNSILLAVSSILQQNRSVGEMSELIAKLANDLSDDGVVGAQTLRDNLISNMRYIRPAEVIENLKRRYDELGVAVNLYDFSQYIDFDGDGIPGNDILTDGEQVTLSETQLDVPCEGRSYTIEIDSPIKLYLDAGTESDSGSITFNPNPGTTRAAANVSVDNVFFSGLYESTCYMTLDTELYDDRIEINVHPIASRGITTKTISLYDCYGTEVATITLSQQGNPSAPLPKLGEVGRAAISGMASKMSSAFVELNLIEQYYAARCATDYIHPASGIVKNCWSDYYAAIRTILQIKDADAKLSSVYQEIFDLFESLCYYHMVVAWGDVPYIPDYEWYNSGDYNIARTSSTEILSKLKDNLYRTIEILDEKENRSMDNADDLFFASKDVARMLLANIHIYLEEYTEALPLLSSVVNGCFYELDNFNYSQQSDIDNIRSGKEIIFALLNNQTTRSITIAAPCAMPLFTYSDALLSYAECLYRTGDADQAKELCNRVLHAKGLASTGDTFNDIVAARKTLYKYSIGSFAFFKRSGLAKDQYNIQEHQLLLPIPEQEFTSHSSMIQNPGY